MTKALVAGGGIAGMAAALALAREGWEVTVFEAAPAPAEVGAGLQMSPNAARVLRWLGVLDAVAATAFRPGAAVLRDGRSGEMIYRAALGPAAEARWGAPCLHVHRADLLSALTGAAEAAGAEIRGGVRVEGYAQWPQGPVLKLEGGATAEGDLAIGADGIRSKLREHINGPEAPDFSGQVAWRGVVPADRLPPGLVAPDATVWAGEGRHLVTYYLRGGALVNFVAVEARDAWTAEGWAAPGDPDILRRAFAGWHESVSRLLAEVRETFLWGLFTRREQVRWTQDTVALIGDAAHPMLPFMAQGAAMALEDVAVLVRALQAGGPLQTALRRFEERRWPRVTRVQAQSRANGALFHRAPGAGRVVERSLMAVVSRFAPDLAARQLDWIYGYDATGGIG